MFQRFVARTLTVAATAMTAATAFAHPGHGVTPPATMIHMMLEPEHAVWLVAGLAALIGYLRSRVRVR